MWQAERVKSMLSAQGIQSEIVKITTKGDRILDVTLSKIGSKGVFTEELEEKLMSGEIDIAVHSAKDLQSSLPDGFEIIAFDMREKSSDVLISHKTIDLRTQGLVLGTSSTRRLAFLAKHFPHISTVSVRGNLQTRIRKMKDGACDALWLAYAGVHRMGYDEMIVHEFDQQEFIPAVGQGSVAIEVYESLSQEKRDAVRAAINHDDTETCLRAERAFLKTMEGGCSVPVYARAVLLENVLTLTGGIISLDGKRQITKVCNSTSNAPIKAGEVLARSVLENGGDKILDEIKSLQSE